MLESKSSTIGEIDCVYWSSFGIGLLVNIKLCKYGDIFSATKFCNSLLPNNGAPKVIHLTDRF